MRSLGVGLIGTGFMGKCHALAWNAVRPVFGDVERPRLVMVADAGAERARRAASEFGFEDATGDWRDLLDRPDIDVVSITAPNPFHAEMAIGLLSAGKHVWCEKPMAPRLKDAERMLEAARASGRVAVLGYNYIQNPVIRQIRRLLIDGAIGAVNHVRFEMDEDFMATRGDMFSIRSEAASGWGALDDFGVHPLSILLTLFGPPARVLCDMAKPFPERPVEGGGMRPAETYDIANVLFRLQNGASGLMALNRAAHGRKGRIFIQIFGSDGAILYDQERMNEFQLYTADGMDETRGFRTILAAPVHPPFGRFVPAPGHGLGFNDLKVIECREFIGRIRGEATLAITFEEGIRIERAVAAIARSFQSGTWEEVPL